MFVNLSLDLDEDGCVPRPEAGSPFLPVRRHSPQAVITMAITGVGAKIVFHCPFSAGTSYSAEIWFWFN
jgi:hypothetical protein